jgi:general secretion pathway protein D
VSALTNTQFQYIDVGVIVDVTPRIHVDTNEVSMKLSVEISSVTSTESIGGINEPVISTKKMEHEVRLKDGEVNILGGLIDHTDSKTVSGWPGLSSVPFLRYFASTNDVKSEDAEILIVIIPHIIRTPNITAENLRGIASGTDTNPEVRLESVVMSPSLPAVSGNVLAAAPAAMPSEQALSVGLSPRSLVGQARLRFEPTTVSIKSGEKTTVGIAVQDVRDLYSVPVILQYDPKIISIEDVHQGVFLSSGTQPLTMVQRIDKEHGQVIVSAARMPNTLGVSGSGKVFDVIVRGIAPGSSTISIPQINARDSLQRKIQLATSEVTVTVQQ